MCTCFTFKNGDFYFGRNMDLEYTFGEKIVITPRNYPFAFRREKPYKSHYAILGMATADSGYPLYAEAVNEKGLCLAGLNFPGNAFYQEPEEKEAAAGIAPFELIPWLLGSCSSAKEAVQKLENVPLVSIPFSSRLPLAPLHWMLSDREESYVLEPLKEGLKICPNPVGVLTNNPPFEFHTMNLNRYMNLTALPPKNRFSSALSLSPYGQGMGSIGLPGDSSPCSRFVRTAFLKENSVCGQDEESCISQVFHILDQVSMVRGAVMTPEEKWDITTYSCCINASAGIYYYKTYANNQIQAVDMKAEDLNGDSLICFDLQNRQQICYVNGRQGQQRTEKL